MRTSHALAPGAALLSAFALAAAGCGGSAGDPAVSRVPLEARGMVVELGEENGSGQVGQASVGTTPEGYTIVHIEATNPGYDQAAGIWKGTCERPGPLVDVLDFSTDGRFEGPVDLGVDQLQAGAYLIGIADSSYRGRIGVNAPPAGTKLVANGEGGENALSACGVTGGGAR